MEYIKVTSENIEKEHICCAISNNNDIQVSSKKAWLSERFGDGLVFLKSKVSLQRHNHKTQQKPSQPTLKRRYFFVKSDVFLWPGLRKEW